MATILANTADVLVVEPERNMFSGQKRHNLLLPLICVSCGLNEEASSLPSLAEPCLTLLLECMSRSSSKFIPVSFRGPRGTRHNDARSLKS